jgi:hypothetical protein
MALVGRVALAQQQRVAQLPRTGAQRVSANKSSGKKPQLAVPNSGSLLFALAVLYDSGGTDRHPANQREHLSRSRDTLNN